MDKFFGLVWSYIQMYIHMNQQNWHSDVQPIAIGVWLNLNLQSQSRWSLFNQTWQKRPLRLRMEIENREWRNDNPNAIDGIYIWIRKPIIGWRGPIGCLKLQVIFRKRATNYRALLRKITSKDKASYGSAPPCTYVSSADSCVYIYGHIYMDICIY